MEGLESTVADRFPNLTGIAGSSRLSSCQHNRAIGKEKKKRSGGNLRGNMQVIVSGPSSVDPPTSTSTTTSWCCWCGGV